MRVRWLKRNVLRLYNSNYKRFWTPIRLPQILHLMIISQCSFHLTRSHWQRKEITYPQTLFWCVSELTQSPRPGPGDLVRGVVLHSCLLAKILLLLNKPWIGYHLFSTKCGFVWHSLFLADCFPNTLAPSSKPAITNSKTEKQSLSFPYP